VDDITAVKGASNFVMRHLSNINDVSLAGIEEGQDGYTIRYNIRYNGLPIYSKQYGYPIIVEVSDGQVVSMKAVSVGFVNKNALTDIRVAVLDAMDISFKQGIKYWNTLRICYIADGAEIRASWKAADKDKTLYIDMENGKL
jgi:hypothetical protein